VASGERARQSDYRLSMAWETQTKYTRQQFKRQETGERLQKVMGNNNKSY